VLCLLVGCFWEWKGSGGDKGKYIPVNCCTLTHADSLCAQNYAHLFHRNGKEHTSAATNPVHSINPTETHSLFDGSRIRLRSPITLLRTRRYSLPLLIFHGAESLKSQKFLNQIFPQFYGTRRFITAPAKVHNLSLC